MANMLTMTFSIKKFKKLEVKWFVLTKFRFFRNFFRNFWLGGAAFLAEGGKASPDLQWKTHPVHKYWVQPDASCHQWGFCDDMFQPRQPGHVFNTFNFQGFSHSLFPNIHLKSFPSASMFISKCCKCILTNKLLTQRGLPFSSPWEAWKHEKWWKIEWKTMKIQGFFKCFNFVAFWGCFKATWGSLMYTAVALGVVLRGY